METDGHPGSAWFVAVDVHYLPAGGARAAAVVAADAAFSRLTGARIAVVPDVAPYQPGQYYLRELPPLRAVLDGLPDLGLLVIDGYADLDPEGRPGLGAQAREEFGIPVIGVAKTPFRTATHAIPILRGTSARPLYITAAGMPRADAADLVRQMAGRHRLPDALRRADTWPATACPSRRDGEQARGGQCYWRSGGSVQDCAVRHWLSGYRNCSVRFQFPIRSSGR